MRALQNSLVRKVLHPERFAKFEARFERHRTWATFVLRFVPGLRIPGYFVVGTLRMSYPRFLLLDGLGVLISVPTSIWFGGLLGLEIKRLIGGEGRGEALVGLLAAAVALALGVRWAARRFGGSGAAPSDPKEPAPKA